ncbi:hypothetical protein [Kitasatospora sp. NPDC086791]|uniref:hypothetical protein n=1 Tax=Kitasatospora sp. NPDC086791 TaxID=3155178 RepID=UPI00342A9D2E
MGSSVLFRSRRRASVASYRAMRKARRGLVLGLGTSAAVLASAALMGRTAWSAPMEPIGSTAAAPRTLRPSDAPWVEASVPSVPVAQAAPPMNPAPVPSPAVMPVVRPAPPDPLLSEAPIPDADEPAPAPIEEAAESQLVDLRPRHGVSAEIPVTAYAAYQRAAVNRARTDPSCHLPWSLLAAIGKVESDHGLGGRLDADGTTLAPILGPPLDGRADVAKVPATDDGKLTQDPVWDHAVGPMQFIPSTWKRWAQAGRPNAEASPHNIFDAAATAGAYLCADHRDLSSPQQLKKAINAYNRSNDYLREVLTWTLRYSTDDVQLAAATPTTAETASTGPAPSTAQEPADQNEPASATVPLTMTQDSPATAPPFPDGPAAEQPEPPAAAPADSTGASAPSSTVPSALGRRP